jgi:Plasmid pRiA4b ORF-3-like protein
MKPTQNPLEIYQLRVVLRETSPHIWRRFLVRSDSSIVDLHQTIQIAFGWSGRQVFEFDVQGHRRGVRLEGDAHHILLADFRFYVKERFTYVYNIADQESRPWRFELRLEQKVAMDTRQHYPRCIGGLGAPPPELCGGSIAFESLRDLFTPEYVAWWTEEMHAEGWTAEHDEELRQLQPWIHRKLDRRVINQQLRQGGDLIRKERAQL